MPYPTLAVPARYPKHTLASLGDSITFNFTLGVLPHQFWTEVACAYLRSLTPAYLIKGRNFGRSGNASGTYLSATGLNADTLSRLSEMTMFDTPDIAIIAVGVNDPGDLWGPTPSQAAPTTGAYSAAIISSSTQSAITVPAPTAPATAFTSGQYLITGTGTGIAASIISSITSGGTVLNLASPLRVAPTGIARQGTRANIEYMVQSLLNAGVQRIIILDSQFKNYSAGGDSVATPERVYQDVRYFQYQAWTSFDPTKVIFVSLYNAMRAILQGAATSTTNVPSPATATAYGVTAIPVTGKNPFGATNQVVFGGITYTLVDQDAQWHVSSANQHLNALGEYIAGRVVAQAIIDQQAFAEAHNPTSAWATPLTF